MDFYDEILDFYENNSYSKELSEFAFLKFIINIMNEYNYCHEEIKNYLILLLNLVIIEVPDRFNNIGKSINALTSYEHKEYQKILSYELLS